MRKQTNWADDDESSQGSIEPEEVEAAPTDTDIVKPVEDVDRDVSGPPPRSSNYERKNRDYEHRQKNSRNRGPIELPSSPPFTAFVGNLSFATTQNMLGDFFYNGNCDVIDVKIHVDGDGRSRGIAHVEFGDRASLERALTANGELFDNRRLKVDVDIKRNSRPPTGIDRARRDESGDMWSRGELRKPRSGGRGHVDVGRDALEKPQAPEPPTRPVIKVLERTLPKEDIGKPITTKLDIFGGAKPNDTIAYEEEKKKKEMMAKSSSIVSGEKEPVGTAKEDQVTKAVDDGQSAAATATTADDIGNVADGVKSATIGDGEKSAEAESTDAHGNAEMHDIDRGHGHGRGGRGRGGRADGQRGGRGRGGREYGRQGYGGGRHEGYSRPHTGSSRHGEPKDKDGGSSKVEAGVDGAGASTVVESKDATGKHAAAGAGVAGRSGSTGGRGSGPGRGSGHYAPKHESAAAGGHKQQHDKDHHRSNGAGATAAKKEKDNKPAKEKSTAVVAQTDEDKFRQAQAQFQAQSLASKPEKESNKKASRNVFAYLGSDSEDDDGDSN